MQQARVFVVGDLMLDTYIRGKVTRISPEAPVPVLLEQEQWSVLGGAANVAANIAAFGGSVVLAGRIGNDRDGEQFTSLCAKAGVDASCVFRSATTHTTRKLRVIAGYQQIVRIDTESPQEISSADESVIQKQFELFLKKPGPRAFVISDYGKGVLTEPLLQSLIKKANAAGVPVITDPKSPDLKRYSGSDIVKPNLAEGRAVLKMLRPAAEFSSLEEEVSAVAAAVLEGAAARNIVLSLSDRGVVAQGKDLSEPLWYSSTAAQVADVSGAGDTMIAFLAMGVAAGLGIDRSVKLANIGAGIVCSKLGTSSVSASEFLKSFKDQSEDTSPEKILLATELAEILEQARSSGKKVVFTNGCFDLLHAGHVQVLQRAKSFGDILVVGLNADSSVKELKGPKRPVQTESDRAQIMAALACVDYVVIFAEETPLELIRKLKPGVLVKGGDWSPATIVGASDVYSWGGQVEVVPLVAGRSTTAIIERSRS